MGQLSSGHQTEKFSPAPRHCQHRSSHCPLCVIMFSLKALAVVLTVASLAEAHSPQKRETTVSNFSPREARTVAGIDLSTVLGIVLVIFSAGAGKRSSQTGLFNWGLPDFSGVYSSVSQMYNSIDLLDMAFNYMDIEDETCRMKTICQAENYAVNHPVARLAINTLNSSLRGLEKYQHAVVAGQNGEDCSLLYDQCPFTYFGLEY